MPATLSVYESCEKTNQTREHIRQLLRGWVASPMVELEGFGQSRLDIFDTIHDLINVVENACTQSDKEIQEAVEEYIGFHSNQQEALKNLKYVFQGYCGSVVVEKAGEGEKRGAVVDTYYELVAIVKELFARS